MHVNSSKLSSGSVFALFTALLFLARSGTTDAQSTSRSFQTGLYVDYSEPALTKADADIAMFGEGQPQPPGRSIMKLKSFDYATPILAGEGYDWSRIVAVLIDEPYMYELQVAFPGTNQEANPCHDSPGPRIDVIYRTQEQLAAAASLVQSVAPWARLWVNFTTHEVDWMAETACSLTLNQPNIDVISVDEYYDVFDPAVKSRYAWFVAHRATPQQQVALIPGTFYRPGQDDPARQAGLLQGYFDYADNANQSCNLPLGPRGVTGSFDGCPVWMVLGFAADTFVEDGTTYVGELDPRNAAVIATIWREELALPVRPGLSLELTRQQIVSTLMRQWLTN